ncbi:hypothetical protein [Myxosarcina sp. GI1(2024)]
MSIDLALEAFSIGTLCAGSLPLGSLTSVVWQPKNWTLAFLIAFGAGVSWFGVIEFELRAVFSSHLSVTESIPRGEYK